MTEHDIRVSARTARLTADVDDTDGGRWTFSGVAVGEGDILHMDDGTPVLFTAEELQRAGHTQADEPLSVDHPRDDDGSPVYPPPTDKTVGTVAQAGYVPGKGVAYEATTHDEDIAKGVRGQSYEVSVHPSFTLGEKDPETGAYIAENVNFQDLSVVSKGDSPSNTVQWGPNQALASWTNSTDIGEELEAADSDDLSESEAKSLVARLADRFGITASETDVDEEEAESNPEEDEESESNEPAESGADADEETDTMGDNPDDPEGGEQNTVEVDIGEHDSFDEFLNEKVTEQVEQATAQKKKSEKVDEIIAESDDYDEDDREALMASADKVVDNTHKQATKSLAASLPGTAGGRQHKTHTSEDGDDLEAYGTGVGN